MSKQGRIILVGVTGLELNEHFYEGLSFQVSCSYGPGRYDQNYEANGQDYPIGFVRWTEQRNFEAVVDTLAAKRLDVRPLITHRYELSNAPAAYDLLIAGNEPVLGILLDYPAAASESTTVEVVRELSCRRSCRAIGVGVLGAGSYSGRTLLRRSPARRCVESPSPAAVA
jgi:hypothetical protein